MTDKIAGIENAGLEDDGQQHRMNDVLNHLWVTYLQRETTLQQCEQEEWLSPTERASAG